MRFTLAAWFLSRALIAAVFVAATTHPIAAIDNWDGAWYESIAGHGYGYARIGAQSDIAFFPLFPLSVRLLTVAHIPWTVAAAAFNNACFLGAMLLAYRYARRRWGATDAAWCVAFACACPMSLFASVAYPEALYMLLSAVALTAYDRRSTLGAFAAAALAGAASAIGVALAAAFVLVATVRRQWPQAAFALVSFSGLAGFAAFCAIRFGDPLAFMHAQHAWRSGFGFDAQAWWNLIRSLTSIEGLRRNLMELVLVPVAALAVFVQRRSLGLVLTSYALLALALLLFSGEPVSVDRKAFTVLPVLFVLGRSLRGARFAGPVAIAALLALLAADTWSFARFAWVG